MVTGVNIQRDAKGHVTGVTVDSIKMPGNPNTDTNTHYTTRIYAGASGTASNASASNPYVKITDDNVYRNQIQIKGSGATTVSSDANGVITISSTDTNTHPDLSSYAKKTDIPSIPSLSGGSGAEAGKYVSGVTVSGHAVTVTKGNLPTIPTALKNPNAITLQVNGSTKVTYDGSSAQTFNVTASDLGLSAAMRFRGTTTTAISDGSTTKTVTIGSASHTAVSGDVVLYNNKEFIWNGSSWEEVGYPVDLSGYITGVTAGNGLTGGGSSGDVTLHVGAGTGITVNADTIEVKYGTTAGTACQGNDSRLSNSRPASDVYAWAKASTKPSYTKLEVGLGNVDNTADANKSVASAAKLTTARTI